MTQQTPHPEAQPSLEDGIAAIAGGLRAMAGAQARQAGARGLMRAAILALLVSMLLRLGAMIRDWQQGRLTLPQTPAPIRWHHATARPDSLHQLHRLARRIRRRASLRAPLSPPAAAPACPQTRPAPAAGSPTTPPGARRPPCFAREVRGPAPAVFSKPALAVAPSRAYFVTIS